MDNLEERLNSTKSSYRQFFLKFAEELNNCVYDIKPKELEGEIFDEFSENSVGKNWQKAVFSLITDGISKDVYKKLLQLKEYRKSQENLCQGCGNCCKLAISEFSEDELKEKAQNNDEFATQFLSVFVPYNTEQEAYEVYPEYFELLKKTSKEKVYFYHCPKVTFQNKCPDYENRPQICKDYPDNPFSFLHKECGFQVWKEKVENESLKLQAMVEILDFYKNKLTKLLED